MNLLTTLNEALNYKQQEYLRKLSTSGGYMYSPYSWHDDIFRKYSQAGNVPRGNSNRIIIPLEKTKGIADKEVQRHLAKNGWFVHNYTSGLAGRYVPDRDGNKKLQLKSIGKILQQTGGDDVNHSQLNDRLIKDKETGKPLVGKDGRYISEKVPQSLLHFYNNDPTRASSNHEMNVVVSRDREDIGGMSSGRSWEADSCMRLPHTSSDDPKCQTVMEQHKHLKGDFKHGTLVVYATKKGDDNIEKPTGRVLLKRYEARGKPAIYRMEGDGVKSYGNLPNGFTDAVKKFAEDNWPQQDKTTYKLASGLYPESHGRYDTIAPVKKVNGLVVEGSTKQHFKNGRLHDYVDENGEHRPAYERVSPDGEIIRKHYKDGVEHNDNGASTYIRNANGSEYFEHKVNGEFHNPNGASRLLKLNGASEGEDKFGTKYTKLEEHHIGGMLHREGDLPASVRHDTDGLSHTQYAVHGLLHRDGGKPSNVLINPKSGYKETQYHQWGELHSPDGITPSRRVTRTYNDGSIESDLKEWHENGISKRKGNLPAKVELQDGVLIKTWTNENGLEHTNDDSKPSRIRVSVDTKKVIGKSFKKDGEFYDRGGKPSLISMTGSGTVKKMYKLPNDVTYFNEKDGITGKVANRWVSKDGLHEDSGDVVNAPDMISHYENKSEIHYKPNGDIELKKGYGSDYIISKDGIKNDLNMPIHDTDKETIKKLLENGMKSPYVGKHYRKLYSRIKSQLV